MPERGALLLAGVDVGTNATKCLICDLAGNVVGQGRYDYVLSTPRPGWVEQDAEELWQAVASSVRQAVGQVGGAGEIVALSLSSQGGTTIIVDAQGRPLRPAISWLDARGAEQGRRLLAQLGQDRIYNITGWELNTALPIVHIPWLAEHEPRTLRQASHILFVNDFINWRLSGRLVMDPSDAALTMLYNIETGAWDAEICAAIGLDMALLSPIEDSGSSIGTLLPSAAAELGLPPTTLLVNGAHDQYCAALGAGVIAQGDVLLSTGTAWVLLAAADRLLRDPRHTLCPGRHALPGKWGLLCSMPAAGASMEWLVRNVVSQPGDSQPRYDLLDRNLADPEPGAHGLVFLPYLGGIEAATHSAGVWGTLTGLSLAHNRWHIAQALMEGVALELRWILERLSDMGSPPAMLRVVGGATRSPIWPQIVADATGLPLSLPNVSEGAARGAAMLAGLGAAAYANVQEALDAWKREGTVIAPRGERTEAYAALYGRFRALDRALRHQAGRDDEGEQGRQRTEEGGASCT